MLCSKCKNKAVFSDPRLCSQHFIAYFEAKVASTIRRFSMVSQQDRLGVAVSGGKDSISCLYILNKLFPGVTAIAIDEGIKGYREKTLKQLSLFCSEHNIVLKVFEFRKEFGKSLDSFVAGLKNKSAKQKGNLGSPCTICGAFRRHIMNKCARKLGMTKLATGHNLDDEAQAVMMNFLKNNLSLSIKLGPVVGVISSGLFVPRIKPLYFCTEKEVMAYAFLKKLPVALDECPYAHESFRRTVQEALNRQEKADKGSKKALISNFLEFLPLLRERLKESQELSFCENCGEISRNRLCKACSIAELLSR